MTNLTKQEQYINNLMDLCITKKIHPTELQGLVRKALRQRRTTKGT